MNEKVRQRIKYWMLLFNPVWIVLYGIGLRYIYQLCQFGGVRRRIPIIAACAAAGIIWMVSWTILYLVRKRKGLEKSFEKKNIYLLLLCLELLIIIAITLFYGTKIVHSAKDYNGKLSWKIEELKNSRHIPFEHDNFYVDGVDGFFDTLQEKIELPSELYIVNKFSMEFDLDGTITNIDTYFYGKGKDGEAHTYLIDYNRDRSEEITVWLDGYAGSNYEETKKLEPMFQILDRVDIQEQVKEWMVQDNEERFSIVYQGYHTIEKQGEIILVNKDGSINERKSTMYGDGMSEEMTGYEVSLSRSGGNQSAVVRYLNTWEKVDTKEKEIGEQVDQDNAHETGKCITDSSDGTLSYYMDQDKGWRLVITDAAAGSRYYEMEFTEDAGVTWDKINVDPFGGNIGAAEGIVFFDNELGYIGMGTATAEYASIYVTKDGGKTFETVELPIQEITDTTINVQEYDYVCMPYMEGSVIHIEVKKEKNSEEKGMLFLSEDNGDTWKYNGLVAPR